MKAFICMVCGKEQWLEKMYFYNGVYAKLNLNGDTIILQCCNNPKCIDALKFKISESIVKTISDKKILNFLQKENEKTPTETIIIKFKKEGFSEQSIKSSLERLRYNGNIYIVSKGFFKSL